MATGTIRKWFPKFNYGFLTNDLGGRDVYFKTNDEVSVGDRVEYEELTAGSDRVFARNVKIIARVPKPEAKPLIRRTGFVREDFEGRTYTFLRDEVTGHSVFLHERVAKSCGLQLERGDPVVYELDPSKPPSGSCPAAVSVALR